MKKNTSSLWDGLWKQNVTLEEDVFALALEEHCIRWKRMERIVLQEFSSFDHLKVIEIGAGAGTIAALMAKRGANVTVLDYSEKALERAQQLFERNGLDAEFIQQDALILPESMKGQYDIAMSFGLTEHFQGADRVCINQAHFELLRKYGIAFISVPNKWNLPYRIYKFGAEAIGIWKVGEEYPYSRGELRRICETIGNIDCIFFGDSLLSSFRFVNPLRILGKVIRTNRKRNGGVEKINDEKGTPLDEYLSYALVLCGKKL